MSETAPPSLVRAVSRWQIVALALNDVVGSGVYLLPAAAAAVLAGASLHAVLLAGGVVFLLVLCFAEAASRFDEPGSGYLYARAAWGELAGLEVGFMTWLARVASVASLSVGFAQAVAYLAPAAGGGAGRVVTIVLPLLALTALNVAGVRWGATTSVVLVIGKLLPLVAFVVVGLPHVDWSRLAIPESIDTARLPEVVLLLLFAYAGFENTAAPAGEFKNPRRDIPFALMVEIAVVTALYASVQLVAVGTLPGIAGSKTPLADAARLFLGTPGGILMTAGAAISILGTNGNTVLAGPRYLYALARQGFGPRFLAEVHPRFGTPAKAIVFQTLVVLPLALTGGFVELAALSVTARLTTYLSTAAAVPVLRRKLGERPGAVRLPFGALIPSLGVLVCLVLAASATRRNLVAGALALGVGLVVYGFRRPPEPVSRSERPTGP